MYITLDYTIARALTFDFDYYTNPFPIYDRSLGRGGKNSCGSITREFDVTPRNPRGALVQRINRISTPAEIHCGVYRGRQGKKKQRESIIARV